MMGKFPMMKVEKNRIQVFTAQILTTAASNIIHLCLLCRLESCATMNTLKLHVYNCLITTHPHLVTEFIQYDYANMFQPLKLVYTVKDQEQIEYIYDNLTAIVRYWLRYQVQNKYINLSFELGTDLAANLIIGLPTLR